MKRYIVLALVCVISLPLFAQITLGDSLANKISGYAGLVGIAGYQFDTTQTVYDGNLRVGGAWNLSLTRNRKFRFSGFGFYQTGIPKPIVVSIRIQYQPVKQFWVMAGEVPSAGAWELLPAPASQSGQFQVTPQNMITGKGTGVLASLGSDSVKLIASAQLRDRRYGEYQVCAVWHQFAVLGIVQTDTVTRYSASIQMDTKPLTIIATANQQMLGGFVGFPIGGAGYRVLCDIGCGWDKRSWAVESGVVQNWKVGMFRVKGAITWSERYNLTGHHRSLNLYILLTL